MLVSRTFVSSVLATAAGLLAVTWHDSRTLTSAQAPPTQVPPAPGVECTQPYFDPSLRPVVFGCVVYSGAPGILDGVDGHQIPDSTPVKTCEDRKPGMYCLYDKAVPSMNVVCTGDGKPGNNYFNKSCHAPGSYTPNTDPCFPKSAADPSGPGMCKNSNKPYPDGATKFDKMPCDYYANVVIPPGQKRYFCAGLTAGYLLECPTNRLAKCHMGCTSLFDANKQPCGKAACAGYNPDAA